MQDPLNRREGHIYDRDIEHNHELGRGEKHQGQPFSLFCFGHSSTSKGSELLRQPCADRGEAVQCVISSSCVVGTPRGTQEGRVMGTLGLRANP